MIVVVETLRATAGKIDLLKKAVMELIPIARKEKGCLQYDLLESVNQEDELLVLMRWKSLADHKNHESSDYIGEFIRKYDKVLYDEAKVTEWKSLVI